MLAILGSPVIAEVFCVERERMYREDGFNKVAEKTENDMRDDMSKMGFGCRRPIWYSDQIHP